MEDTLSMLAYTQSIQTGPFLIIDCRSASAQGTANSDWISFKTDVTYSFSVENKELATARTVDSARLVIVTVKMPLGAYQDAIKQELITRHLGYRLVSEDEILTFIRSQPLLNYREFCNTFGEGVYTESAYKRLHWHLNLTKGI